MKQCTVEGCKRKYHAKGYCGTHYGRWRQGREIGGAEVLKGRRSGGFRSGVRNGFLSELPDDLKEVYGTGTLYNPRQY